MDKALNENILVTVLLPVYNSEMFLREAIDSILSQSFKVFEFLIIKTQILAYNIIFFRSHSSVEICPFRRAV